MARNTVFVPHLQREMRLGGCRVEHIPLHHSLKFAHLLHAAAPTPPTSTNFAASAQASIAQMYGNDQLGDCVIAARAHRIGLLTGAASGGSPFLYTMDQILAEYSRIGGYVQGNPATDNGCDPVVSANDGVKVGYADGSKDLGWVAINASSPQECALAIWTTENADLSMALPQAWVSTSMPQKDFDVWDVAGDPVPENGHNIEVLDFDQQKGLLCATWGLKIWVTWAAAAKYGVQDNGGMLISHLNPDQLAKAAQKAPDGIDWATIVTYFDQNLGGNVPIPTPPLPPTPPAGSPVSLVEAQAWAAAGIKDAPVIMTRNTAARYAAYGLTTNWPKSS